ncbi:MAG: phosphate ABC transporter ATP-binding protein [Gammaproteobacteria bacterium]|nr:phosphate ABC transporter ATP-binding protein [Gammaproteobacteria bacterium]MDT8311875.1 phosphate ABC transporter ATP-binding protein [Methylophaga sp.]
MALQTKGFTLGQLTEAKTCCEPIPHLSVHNLSVKYQHKTVLENVNLDIYKGCITALIGPSGCGKTSFLSTLNRMTDMIAGASVSGKVLFHDDNILNQPIDLLTLRRQIGMIFQKPNPFPLSIYRNLALPLREIGIKDKQLIDYKIETVLKDVGLWQEVHHQLDMTATKLSGGQQQRLCIARALVLEPEILLMDEPCSALDPISSAVVEDLIVSLRGRYTVVIVTHNLAQAKRVANYAGFFWMQERVGKLVEFGRSQHLFDQPQNELTAAFVNGRKG